MEKKLVSIIVGSDSDLGVIQNACDILVKFEVPFDLKIISAHRTPEMLKTYMKEAEVNGVKVFIGAAGCAAHLPGVIASATTLPVIGVPLNASALNGVDALYAIVQMPAGIPVLTTAIGKAGAVNAALGAIQILSTSDSVLKSKLDNYRKEMVKKIEDKNAKLDELGYQKYVQYK